MRTKGKSLASWGLALQIGYLVDVVSTLVGKHRAFPLLADKAAMQTDAGRAAVVSIVTLDLYMSAAGATVAILGVVLLGRALFGVKYRAIWFRTALWMMAVLWLFKVPVGTVLGLVFMIYLAMHHEEFNEPPVPGIDRPDGPPQRDAREQR